MSNTELTIQRFVQKNLLYNAADAEIRVTDSLLDSGLIDSMAVLKLVSFVESEFGLEVTDEEVVPENFETIEAIVRLVESKRAG